MLLSVFQALVLRKHVSLCLIVVLGLEGVARLERFHTHGSGARTDLIEQSLDVRVGGPGGLAEREKRFVPLAAGSEARAEALSWLMFIASGIGPYSGQCVHFRNVAPAPKDYAVNRYVFEARRHWGIIEAQLGKHAYLLGDDYTYVDMALWGWARLLPFVLGLDGYGEYPNIGRFVAAVNARPAAVAALALKDKHSFKAEMDEAAKLAMFPHLGVKVA